MQQQHPFHLQVRFQVDCALFTPIEVDYYRHGGILNYVLREFLKG